MKFLADMGVSPKAVVSLRAAGHDAVHLREEGLHRLPDDAVFAKARAEGRIVLTFDLDFGEIVAMNAGSVVNVVVFRMQDTRTERVIERLADVLEQSSDALQSGSIVVSRTPDIGYAGCLSSRSSRRGTQLRFGL